MCIRDSLSSGTVATARLGSGTASSSVYLRGDGTWAAVSAGAASSLDGLASTQFLRSDVSDSFSGQLTSTSSADEKIILSGSTNPYIRWQESTTNKAYIQWNSSGYLEIVNQEDNSRIKLQDNFVFTNDGWSNTYKIWNESNDGSGSGLDADTVDGIQASSFVRGDQDFVLTKSSTWILYNNLSDWAVRISNSNGTNSNIYMLSLIHI